MTDLERIERKLDRILHLLGDAELVIQIITGIIALAILIRGIFADAGKVELIGFMPKCLLRMDILE